MNPLSPLKFYRRRKRYTATTSATIARTLSSLDAVSIIEGRPST
jgi:hypothetical protein